MENATKGLMIVGAILIALVLVGIGVALVGQAQGWIEKSGGQISEMEIKQFNTPFEMYEGMKKGTEIKNLLTMLNTNNNLNITASDTEKIIGLKTIKGSGNLVAVDLKAKTMTAVDAAKIISVRASVNTGKTYKVELGVDSKTALINQITITEQ